MPKKKKKENVGKKKTENYWKNNLSITEKKNNIPNKLVNKWIIEENVSNAINVKNKILIHKKKNALQIIKKKRKWELYVR